jgi:DMSO/TMAO reductase YedYZ heme-binding membrane subunit
MKFLLVLVMTTAACFALRNPIRRWPIFFYVLSVLACLGLFVVPDLGLPRAVWMLTLIIMQKCLLPTALFIVVMYIGVLPRASRPALWLRPIRSELSIIAWILSLGHATVFLMSYIPKIAGGFGVNLNVTASILVAIVLFALLIMLGVTSFQAVRKRMRPDTWVKVQRWAYVFFALVYVHVMLMLMPSAILGAAASQLSVLVYSVVFIAYAVLRILRYRRDGEGGEHGEAAVAWR